MIKRTGFGLAVLAALTVAAAPPQSPPKIWDDEALDDWATPIAALGVRPGHFTSAEYYRAPVSNLKTYPVYRPDREPAGYWEWLEKQKPEPLIDASKLHTREDWIKAGEIAFRTMDEVGRRTSDPERLRVARDSKSYDGIWLQQDGSSVSLRWVVTDQGLQLTETACASCHMRGQADGTILRGAPPKRPQRTHYSSFQLSRPVSSKSPVFLYFGDSRAVQSWRGATVPWDPDPRIERQRTATEEENLEFRRSDAPPGIGVVTRRHGSPYYPTKTPDLNTLRYSRYIDATGTHRLRGPEDVARYAAFVTDADSMDFGDYHLLEPKQRRVPVRYADEILYAIGMYLMSLEPPKNPTPPAPALLERGRRIFARETCIGCHVPPNYTSGMLTLAQGFTVSAGHPNRADILNICVGTDPGLALHTRKGTGFYRIPSLRGLWYRSMLLHDGSVATLDEMFDPDRLKPDHVPGGWPGPGVTRRAIPGHPFGLKLKADEKAALLAFLRSL